MKKSVLNSIKIYENFVNFDKIDFWCDYLRLSFTNPIPKFDELLFWIDSDNSNFWIVSIDNHNITYNKTITSNGFALTFITEYNWISIPLFQYVKFNKDTRKLFHKSAKLDFYGSYFRLEAIWEFSNHALINYIKSVSFEDPDITRYDYRIDYFSIAREVSIPSPDKICWYIHKKSNLVEWKSWWKLTDWLVWNSQTWKYAIRYYDKKLDTNKKNKWFLYTDFLDYKSVHRLEFEFWRAFCREFSLSHIDDLEWKILAVLGLEGKILERSIFYQYDSTSEITLENAWNFIKRFQNLWEKLYKAWYNPLKIIEQNLVSKYWIEVTRWLIDDFLNSTLFINESVGKN